MLAKLTSAGFFPPITITFVFQTPALSPLIRKKNQT